MKKAILMKHLKSAWHFIWEDDSALSWIVNIVLSFILIKFIVYPGLGLALGTTHPIVAVVSGSMEHDGSFDAWWSEHENLYADLNISKETFRSYPFKHGFNTGDIMVLKGKPITDISKGDVIVYWGSRKDPIIHRVVDKWNEDDEAYFRTKGDHNLGSNIDELKIDTDRIVGYPEHEKGSVAIIRIPLLGYIKIGFVWVVQSIMHII